MIIYLYGKDSYRRQLKLNEIVGNYRKKHSSMTIEKFFFPEEVSVKTEEFARLKEFVKNQSLFDEFKLAIILGDLDFPNKDFREFLKSYHNNKNVILLISVDRKPLKEFDFLFKEPAISQNFEELSERQLADLVSEEMKKRGLKPEIKIINALIRANGSDLWGIINSLNKLELGGNLEDNIGEPDFFSLIGRIKRGDVVALEILLNKQDPAKIFNIIASQAGPELKEKMADYDVAIKSGKLDYEEALLDAILT